MSLKMNNNENLGQILEFKTKICSFCQAWTVKKGKHCATDDGAWSRSIHTYIHTYIHRKMFEAGDLLCAAEDILQKCGGRRWLIFKPSLAPDFDFERRTTLTRPDDGSVRQAGTWKE
jgi:hypothetical protein